MSDSHVDSLSAAEYLNLVRALKHRYAFVLLLSPSSLPTMDLLLNDSAGAHNHYVLRLGSHMLSTLGKPQLVELPGPKTQ